MASLRAKVICAVSVAPESVYSPRESPTSWAAALAGKSSARSAARQDHQINVERRSLEDEHLAGGLPGGAVVAAVDEREDITVLGTVHPAGLLELVEAAAGDELRRLRGDVDLDEGVRLRRRVE